MSICTKQIGIYENKVFSEKPFLSYHTPECVYEKINNLSDQLQIISFVGRYCTLYIDYAVMFNSPVYFSCTHKCNETFVKYLFTLNLINEANINIYTIRYAPTTILFA